MVQCIHGIAQDLVITPTKSAVEKIQHIGTLPMEIKSYHLTSGGLREYDDSLSNIAKGHTLKLVKSSLAKKGFTPNPISEDNADWESWNEIKKICRSVEGAIQLHIFGSKKFQKRINNFDYGIGSIENLCNSNNIDALLIIWGWDENRTARRRKMTGGAIAGSIARAVVGALIGFGGGVAVPRSDYSFISGMLINKEGKILWYNYYFEAGNTDISQLKHAEQCINELFHKFTERKSEK